MRPSRRRHARFVAFVSIALALAALVTDPLTTASACKLLALALVGVVLSIYVTFVAPRPSSARAKRPALSFADASGLGFLALSTLSLAWGSRAGLLDISLWSTAVALVFVLRRYPIGLRQRVLEATAMIVGSVTALWAIVERARHLESTGGQGNPDWLGLTLAIAVPICVATLRRKRHRLLHAALTAVVLAALYLSHSRTGWIAGGVASIVVVIAGWRTRARATISTALIAPGLGNHTGAFREAATGRAWAGRLWIDERSADVALSHPLGGVGLGRYGFGYLEKQGAALAQMSTQEAARHFINATTAHNDYLQIACESGLPAAVLFVWFLVRTLRMLWARASIGALGSVVAFAVCALGDSPLRLPAPVLFFALAFATGKDTAAPWTSLRTTFVRTLQAYLPAAIAIFAGAIAACNYASLRLRTRAALSATAAQERLLTRATELDLTGDAELDLGLYRLAQGSGKAEAAERHLRASSTRLPNAGTFVALGNALAAQDHIREAKSEYERALALNPGSLKAHLNLAEMHRRLGSLDEARKHMEMARAIAPYHPKLLDLVDRLEADDARVLSEELERIDSDDETDGAQ